MSSDDVLGRRSQSLASELSSDSASEKDSTEAVPLKPAARQISAFQRLQALPPVFRGADLTVRFGWTSKTASQYLYLWRRRGLVDALGGHADVYANMLLSPRANWEHALRLAMPSARIIGAEALRRAGWITQVPQRAEVAVRADQPIYATARFDVQQRSAHWFEQVPVRRQPSEVSEVPVLRPAFALADALAGGGWGRLGLDPDDIDAAEIRQADEADWRRAAQLFRLDCDDLRALIAGGEHRRDRQRGDRQRG